ncbi:MAG: hypothetical protein IJF83_11520 [Methanobrevibacter sp.]|nr:hypothetical protein [Methanobrevibacter sp.]
MSFLDDWKEWSTAKKAISIIVVCCIGVIIVAMIGGGLSSDKNTATTSSSNNSDNTANQATGVQIKVIYDGEWQGAAGDVGSSSSISGSGEKTIDLGDDVTIVSADAQKMDGGSGTLTIQILKDGKVIKESSTDSAYGVATVSASV